MDSGQDNSARARLNRPHPDDRQSLTPAELRDLQHQRRKDFQKLQEANAAKLVHPQPNPNPEAVPSSPTTSDEEPLQHFFHPPPPPLQIPNIVNDALDLIAAAEDDDPNDHPLPDDPDEFNSDDEMEARGTSLPLQPFSNPSLEDWVMWQGHFDVMCTLRRFDDHQRRLALHQLMAGPAAQLTQDIPHSTQITVGTAPSIAGSLAAYTKRFLPKAASGLAQAKLANAQQYLGEDSLAFHGRIRYLYNRAYPNVAAAPEHLIGYYVNGLLRQDVQESVRRAHPATFEEALELAQNEDGIVEIRSHKVNKTPGFGQQYPQMPVSNKFSGNTNGFSGQGEPMDISALQLAAMGYKKPFPGQQPSKPAGGVYSCHFCHKSDHFRNTCPQLMKAMDFAGIPAKYWKTGAAGKKFLAKPPPNPSQSRAGAGQYQKAKPKSRFQVNHLGPQDPPEELEEGEIESTDTQEDDALSQAAEDSFENVYLVNDNDHF